MGALIATALQIVAKKQQQILLLGTQLAGKTTILRYLTKKQIKQTIPTIGFTIQEIQYENLKIFSWNIPSCIQKFCYLWRQYYFFETKALIYVFDSANEIEFSSAKDTLCYILSMEEMKGKPVLVLVNKSDVAKMTQESIFESLQLDKLEGIGKWNIQSCCSEKGEGLLSAFEWIEEALRERVIENKKKWQSNFIWVNDLLPNYQQTKQSK